MFHFIRHANRMDRNTEEEKIEAMKYKTDIPLSKLGIQQAIQGGMTFTEKLKGQKIVVFCSPYYRCLQTADIFMKYMSKECDVYQNKIFVEEQIREIEFNTTILNHYGSLLFFHKQNIIDFSTTFNETEGLQKHPFYNPKFDSYTEEDFTRRIQQFILTINKNENLKDRIVIVFTHSFVARNFMRLFPEKYSHSNKVKDLSWSTVQVKDDQIQYIGIDESLLNN